MAGGLKKANKPFKSRHASKRSLKEAAKGKVEKTVANNKALKVVSRTDRRNKNDQLKSNKISNGIKERALFTGTKIDRIITIVPLTKNLDPMVIIKQILSPVNEDELIFSSPVLESNVQVLTVRINRFKSSLKFILPDMSNLLNILDACKVSDFVIFGLSSIEEVDEEYGEQIIRAVQAQGISNDYCVLPDLVTNYPKKNLQLDIYKSLLSFYEHFFPSCDKLFILENANDQLNMLRNLSQKFPHRINWRDSRGYLVADKLDKIDINNDESMLVIEGIVRGNGFNPDNLIHIPGFGDKQIEKIEKIVKSNDMVDDNDLVPTEKRESLDDLIEDESKDVDYDISDMDDDNDDDGEYDDGQDDWNLVNEVDTAPKRRLPKGMTEYHARWYKDAELEEMINEVGLQSDTEELEEVDMDEEEDEMEANPIEDEDDDIMETDLSPEEHSKQLEIYRKRESDELRWPDEIELRPEERATDRLSKYRGVKSLPTTFWDCDEYDENRPDNWEKYLRITNYRNYRIQNIKEFRRNVKVVAGDKVKIFIKFTNDSFEKFQDPKVSPFVVYGLLPHEHKLAVCNFEIKSWEAHDEPIKSKDRMIVQYGFRRYVIDPLISQLTRNANKVSKFQRFLHQGQTAFATAIVPVSMTNTPALFFQEKTEGGIQIIAQGTFANTDFRRVIAKRAVLTGEVYRIHKNVVTIRFMFFHAEDVKAYKNVPIFTKMGRSGFVRESLGTHGEFKASFDGKLNQQDIVGMELFKREWPSEGKEILY